MELGVALAGSLLLLKNLVGMQRKAQKVELFPSTFKITPNPSKPSKFFRLPSLPPTLQISVLGAKRILLHLDSTLWCSLSTGFRILELFMDSLLAEAQETDTSGLNSLALVDNLEGSTSFPPAVEESGDGSSPASNSEPGSGPVAAFKLIVEEELSDDEESAGPRSSNSSGSVPPPPSKTPADGSWSPSSSQGVEASVLSGAVRPTETVDGACDGNSETSSAGNEGAREDEPPPSSPTNLIGHNLSNYGSHWTRRWSPYTASWSSRWSNSQWARSSATMETRVSSDWIETKPHNVVRKIFFPFFLLFCRFV